MSLVIKLPASVEEYLKAWAQQEGRSAEELAAALLIRSMENDEAERDSTIQGIQRGLDDFEQGRFRSFDEFVAEQRAKHGIGASTG